MDNIMATSLEMRQDPQEYGLDFLNKSKGEKALQLLLAKQLLTSRGITNDKPVKFLDFGGGDGWFARAVLQQEILHKNSKGTVYDISEQMLECARKLCAPLRPELNLVVSRDLRTVGASCDIVFLNMVDLCQPTREDLAEVFNNVERCLKPTGVLVITTQNPWARPGVFAHYRTDFARPNKTRMSLETVLTTKVEGVDTPLTDYHRLPHATASSMLANRLKLVGMATIDDNEKTGSFSPESNDSIFARNVDSPWVPLLNSEGRFTLVRVDKSGYTLDVIDKLPEPMGLDPSAPYLGMTAKKLYGTLQLTSPAPSSSS
jgi:SAM-dependent methyltransferase